MEHQWNTWIFDNLVRAAQVIKAVKNTSWALEVEDREVINRGRMLIRIAQDIIQLYAQG